MTRKLAFWLLLIGLIGPLLPLPVAAQNLLIVPLSEVNGSGVFGDASLIDNGDGTTTVDILVTGVTGGHAAVLQTGSCDDLDDVVHQLDSVRQDGTSVSDIDMTLDELVDDLPMAVVILRSSASNATEIACGDIDASDLPPAPAGTRQAPSPTPQIVTTQQPGTTSTPGPTSTPTPTATATPDPALPQCQDFDAWAWAQTVFNDDPEAHAASLDPDGNGIACEELTIHGFAPALWADDMPDGLIPVQATGFYSGDALQVLVNGQLDIVQLRGIAAPTGNQCGYVASGGFLAFVLSFPENFIVFIDYQGSQRDAQNRLVADVWFEYHDDPYLVNEAMVRNGWAQSTLDPEGDPLGEEFEMAQTFAADHVMGLHLACGGTAQPIGSVATSDQLEQARERQPNQGQFGT